MPKPQRNGIKIFHLQICFKEPGIFWSWNVKNWVRNQIESSIKFQNQSLTSRTGDSFKSVNKFQPELDLLLKSKLDPANTGFKKTQKLI
jgi:hypothetical protein